MSETSDEQLEECLASAANGSRIRFADNLPAQIRANLGAVFARNEGKYPDHRDRVMTSARYLGEIAGILASLHGKGEVGLEHFRAARVAVKQFCSAGKTDEPVKTLWEWCGE